MDLTVTAALEPVSPWALRLVATTSTPARRTYRIEPAASGPFVREAGDDTPVVAFGLKPDTSYTLTVEATEAEQTVSATASLKTASARKLRVLFDAAHGQGAGSADWVIDDDSPDPRPASPGAEDDWKGNLSSWGYALRKTGRYELETLGRNGTLTHGGSGAQDLSRFDVLVLCEPNNWGDLGASPTSPSKGANERAAIVAFVKAGGGLVAIGDHAGSDRDNDGVDSVPILNALFTALDAGIAVNRGSDEWGDTRSMGRGPVLEGPFGKVARMSLYAGATFTVTRESGALPLVFRKGTNTSSNIALQLVYGASKEIGSGRLVVWGDSSGPGDGTGRVNDDEKNAWHDANFDHAAFFLNATAWAAGEY